LRLASLFRNLINFISVFILRKILSIHIVRVIILKRQLLILNSVVSILRYCCT